MQSFDFYDTLVTRLVATPADIFSLVGERLRIAEFRSIRIAAEAAARRALGGEVTFEQIYDQIFLPFELKERARALELEFERTLIAPIAAILPRIQPGDLVVSDMYHNERLYREVLERLRPGVVPGAVLISGATGVNKVTGALWKHVAVNYPAHQSHTGDNLRADVHQARRNGLIAFHYRGATLNRYESALAKLGGDNSFLAGVSRATRLSLVRSDSLEAEEATIEAFASVIGPVLHAFAHWILRACDEAEIRDIFFLARDGQLPYKYCTRLAAASGQDVRCHYIFASRQALHLPGCRSIEEAESWLLEDTPELSLRIIAERACVPLDVVIAAATSHINIGPEDNIPKGQRPVLRSVIRDSLFTAAFESSVKQAFEPTAAYYLSQGLGRGERIALVDVGWNGRLQRSLGTLLEKAGHRPAKILGLYLCLSRRVAATSADELRGFVADPEREKLIAFFDRYRHVFEAALSADHPTTLGFELVDGVASPLLGQPYPPGTEQKIVLQQAVLNSFIENLLAVGRAAGRVISPSTAQAIENFKLFLSDPSSKDGHAFDEFQFVDGQAGTEAKPICRVIRAIDLLRPPIDLGYWSEGTLSSSGFGVLMRIRKLIRLLLDKSRTRSSSPKQVK